LKKPAGFYFCISFIFILLSFNQNSSAQVESKDIKDVTKKWKKDTTRTLRPKLEIGKSYISILPVVGYAPANGFLAGGVMSISRLFGPDPTKLSSGMINAQVTTKGQFIINARSKIYLNSNRWFLQGDWRMLFFKQPTYGLGINNTGGNKYLLAMNNLEENTPPEAEPMSFNYLRIYEDVVRKIGNSDWFVGAGISVDRHYDIRDEKLNTDSAIGPVFITNHYAYSVSKGFSPKEYFTTGFNLDVMTDTRDNISNAYKGYYGLLSFRVNPYFSKSSQQSTMLFYDLRYYWGLSKAKPRKVLAFWTTGSFVMSGNVPYLALPSIGWDTYNRSGRGYIQGRYRGLSMVYAEAEYRYPISKSGLFGGVFFVNTTFASSTDQKLFSKTAPGIGAGFRMMMDKLARVNLTVDLAYGLDHSSGIYFSMQETF
jgi:hypothetical protein